jgi:hypothetical protein
MKSNLDAFDERTALYAQARGHCQTCGNPVAFDAFQLAHCIANSKANRRKYGAHIIDHPMNKRVTCPGRCNDAQNCGFDPGKCAAIVREIRESDLCGSV